MSQRKLRWVAISEDGQKTRYEAMAGWDAPLGWAYLSIFRVSELGGDEEMFWDSIRLVDPRINVPDILMVIAGFVGLGNIPKDFVLDLKADVASRAGNVVKTYAVANPVRS